MTTTIHPGTKILAGKIAKRTGTVGVIVRFKGDLNSPLFLSSAWHVLNPKKQQTVEVMSENGDRIAVYHRGLFRKIRGIDIAFAQLEGSVVANNKPNGKPGKLKKPKHPNINDQLTKVGATTGETKGKVNEIGEVIAMVKHAVKIRATGAVPKGRL